jgi:hypothetical protein
MGCGRMRIIRLKRVLKVPETIFRCKTFMEQEPAVMNGFQALSRGWQEEISRNKAVM